MSLTYRGNKYEAASGGANSTKTTEVIYAKYRGTTYQRRQPSEFLPQFLPQCTQELTYRGINYHHKHSKNPKSVIDPNYLKNPDPSNAFSFVITVAVAAILLPFIPIAVNYFSQLIDYEKPNTSLSGQSNNPQAGQPVIGNEAIAVQ